MPKIDNIEETPNPNAVKFILKEPVTAGTTRSFHSAEDAAGDPLAGPLFAVGDVSSVFYMDRMITVEKADEADWDDLLPRLAVPIRAAEGVATNGGGAPPPSNGQAAGVGGWLEVLSLEDNRLTIRYQGACGSCPSSLTGTLMGIESLIRQEIDPEIEV